MFRPWTKFINVGIVHPMIFPECGRGEGQILETASKIIFDDFFGAIEVSWVKDPEVRKKLSRLLAEGHLDIIFSGNPPMLAQKLSLSSLEAPVRKKSITGTQLLIDEAYEVGAKVFIILSGPMPPLNQKEQATKILVESLKELCDYAKLKGNLMITLENFDVEYEKKCIIGPTADAAAVAKAVRKNYSNFGLTVDLSHLPLLHEKPEEVAVAGPYLEYVHIGNCIMRDKSNPMYGDQHPRFGAPSGENDVPEVVTFLKALDRMGYFTKKTVTSKPVVSFEVKPAPGESSEAVMAGSKRVFVDAWMRMS